MRQMDVTMKKIGDIKFYITPFPAFTTARISGELAKVLAPILGSFAPVLKGAEADGEDVNLLDVNIEDAMPVVMDALSQLDGESFERLMRQLLTDYKNISFDNEDDETERLTYDNANEIFCGEFQDMLLLCWEVIKLNFSGFFKKIAGQSGGLQKIMAQAAKTPRGRKAGTKSGETST